MSSLHKSSRYLLFIFLFTFSLQGISQTVSYGYDNAGNRVSRKIVNLPAQSAVKQTVEPTPVVEQLGERTIKVYPNPTKGALALEISGGNDKPASEGGDPLSIIMYNADGKQILNKQVQQGITPINMTTYPAAYYILRVKAGDKLTEFKIIKQ